MTNKAKPKVAFFDFTCCEGCQLTVVDSLQTHPELLDAVDIVEFREAMSEKADAYDIAFIEGSCSRASDEERLRDIRDRSGIVVALGACAHLGGVNAIRNTQNLDDVRKYVYGSYADWYEVYEARAISKVIEVDVVIPGCPIDRYEFLSVVKALLQGRTPEPPDYPVCIECKLDENVCVFHRGEVCLGPITRAGCEAICPTYGASCVGCRGLIPFPKIDSLKQVLTDHGLDPHEIDAKLTLYLTNQIQDMAPEENANGS
jgi:coenzyme F420-reducing hydrogenase gamma subunit